MTLEKLEMMIDRAISDTVVRPHAHEATNVLNAEYGLGKVFALLEVIEDVYGIEAMTKIYDRIADTIDTLMKRTQVIYK